MSQNMWNVPKHPRSSSHIALWASSNSMMNSAGGSSFCWGLKKVFQMFHGYLKAILPSMQGEDTSFNIPSWRGVMQNENQAPGILSPYIVLYCPASLSGSRPLTCALPVGHTWKIKSIVKWTVVQEYVKRTHSYLLGTNHGKTWQNEGEIVCLDFIC